MANADITVDINIEKAIHEQLRQFLQNIRDDFGLQIECVYAEWLDTSTMSKDRATVAKLKVTSTSEHSTVRPRAG